MILTDVWHIERQEELLRMYGKVAVRWAAADLLLVQILGLLLENYQIAHAHLFSAGSGQKRIQTFNNAIGASRLGEQERKQLFEITDTLSKMLPVRNEIIHSPLTIRLAIDGNQIIPSIAKVLKSGKFQKLSLDRVSEHVEKIGRAIDFPTILQHLELVLQATPFPHNTPHPPAP